MIDANYMISTAFGRWKVLAFSHRDKRFNDFWACECSCGNKKIVSGSNLRRGDSLSCGCYNKDQVSKLGRKHFLRGTPEYTAWKQMKGRCCNPRNAAYKSWGARGITICKEWLHDPVQFVTDMGLRPSPKHSLDRIDVNGDYSKENCRWALPLQQMRNMTTNRVFSHLGKEQCLSAWAEELGLNYSSLYQRLYTLNWTFERAISTPIRNKCGKA